jgi:hypothetical protein
MERYAAKTRIVPEEAIMRTRTRLVCVALVAVLASGSLPAVTTMMRHTMPVAETCPVCVVYG